MSYPSFDIYLDSGLIPSLGGDGQSGSVGHHALMGRPILPFIPSHTTALNPAAIKPLKTPPSRNVSKKRDTRSASTSGGGIGMSESSDDGMMTARPSRVAPKGKGESLGSELKDRVLLRPPFHRRTSSMDGRVTMTSTTITELEHGVKKRPIPGSERLPQSQKNTASPASSAPEPGQYLASTQTPDRKPNSIAPVPSIHLSPPHETARHARSSSWSTPLTARPSCIPLISSKQGDDDDDNHPIEKLTKLHRLIPPSRFDPLSAPPSSAALHPPTLLAGLAFILEALVSERQLLSDTRLKASPKARLPLLRDRTSLQSKTHELDWSATHKYLLSFGEVLEAIMGILMESEVCEATLQLVEMFRTYIDKTRKVFGEVAGLYMEGYSFMAGWWDEEGMRGSAKEVGRWGDLTGVRI